MTGRAATAGDTPGTQEKSERSPRAHTLAVPPQVHALEAEGARRGAPGHVDAEGEGIDRVPLHAHIEDADFGVGHTTVVPRLGVRLVLNLPVTPGRACKQKGSELSSADGQLTGESGSEREGVRRPILTLCFVALCRDGKKRVRLAVSWSFSHSAAGPSRVT